MRPRRRCASDSAPSYRESVQPCYPSIIMDEYSSPSQARTVVVVPSVQDAKTPASSQWRVMNRSVPGYIFRDKRPLGPPRGGTRTDAPLTARARTGFGVQRQPPRKLRQWVACASRTRAPNRSTRRRRHRPRARVDRSEPRGRPLSDSRQVGALQEVARARRRGLRHGVAASREGDE